MIRLLLRIILLPFSLLYGMAVRVRNFLFFLGVLPEHSFPVPVIAIGNLSVGGTGKTPLVEYMANLLVKDGFLPAVVSRGYKGSAKGVVFLDQDQTAAEVGDEPYQIKAKYPDVPVVVSQNRVNAIRQIMANIPGVDVIILDDAFQHRYVKPGLSILTTPYARLFTEDFLLPSGWLREPKSAKRRADLIVVTKSLAVLSPFELGRIKAEIKPEPHQNLYFSYLQYQELVDARDQEKQYPVDDFESYKLVLFTGIADPSPLQKYLERKCNEVELVKFGDHYEFDKKAYDKVSRLYSEIYVAEKAVVTTEKDISRLKSLPAWQFFQQLPVYYLPVKVGFHQTEDTPNFDERILNYVRANQRNRPLHSG